MASSEIRTLDIALEMDSISVEYSDISKQGLIRVVSCPNCLEKTYSFSDDIKIVKNGKEIKLEVFLKEYWSIKFPTIFLSKQTSNAVKIAY